MRKLNNPLPCLRVPSFQFDSVAWQRFGEIFLEKYDQLFTDKTS